MHTDEPIEDFRFELEAVLEEFLAEQREATLAPPPWLPQTPCPRVDPQED